MGIWVTCQRGMEGKANAQIRELFDEVQLSCFVHVRQTLVILTLDVLQYASKLYPETAGTTTKVAEDLVGNETKDIEDSVKNELKEAQNAAETSLFRSVRIDVGCG